PIAADVHAIAGREQAVVDLARRRVVEAEEHVLARTRHGRDTAASRHRHALRSRPKPERRAGRESSPERVTLHEAGLHAEDPRTRDEVAHKGRSDVAAVKQEVTEQALAGGTRDPPDARRSHQQLDPRSAAVEKDAA